MKAIKPLLIPKMIKLKRQFLSDNTIANRMGFIGKDIN
ncbi:hypothetical protein LCGC14_0741660 [marine sediment metagenome]|uniref:Uncharacterized protein n=1 Tax=marine sediment metagenome TaxID=412755 RepID=A0A0F9QRH2_9ZZZZ